MERVEFFKIMFTVIQDYFHLLIMLQIFFVEHALCLYFLNDALGSYFFLFFAHF